MLLGLLKDKPRSHEPFREDRRCWENVEGAGESVRDTKPEVRLELQEGDEGGDLGDLQRAPKSRARQEGNEAQEGLLVKPGPSVWKLGQGSEAKGVSNESGYHGVLKWRSVRLPCLPEVALILLPPRQLSASDKGIPWLVLLTLPSSPPNILVVFLGDVLVLAPFQPAIIVLPLLHGILAPSPVLLRLAVIGIASAVPSIVAPAQGYGQMVDSGHRVRSVERLAG